MHRDKRYVVIVQSNRCSVTWISWDGTQQGTFLMMEISRFINKYVRSMRALSF